MQFSNLFTGREQYQILKNESNLIIGFKWEGNFSICIERVYKHEIIGKTKKLSTIVLEPNSKLIFEIKDFLVDGYPHKYLITCTNIQTGKVIIPKSLKVLGLYLPAVWFDLFYDIEIPDKK